MRKLVLFLHQSLDGYCATTDGALNWIPFTSALEEYNARVVKTAGAAVYGRVTYEMMKGYWPAFLNDPSAPQNEREHAEWLENAEKYVVSATLGPQDWKNTTVIKDNVEEEFRKLKEQDGKDLMIFGSPTLARSLMKAGLIDEFQFTSSPVILGGGLTFLGSVEDRVNLELIESEPLEGGVMGLHYRVLR